MTVTCVVSDTVANVASEIETLFDAPTLSAPHGTQAQCKLCSPRLAFIRWRSPSRTMSVQRGQIS